MSSSKLSTSSEYGTILRPSLTFAPGFSFWYSAASARALSTAAFSLPSLAAKKVANIFLFFHPSFPSGSVNTLILAVLASSSCSSVISMSSSRSSPSSSSSSSFSSTPRPFRTSACVTFPSPVRSGKSPSSIPAISRRLSRSPSSSRSNSSSSITSSANSSASVISSGAAPSASICRARSSKSKTITSSSSGHGQTSSPSVAARGTLSTTESSSVSSPMSSSGSSSSRPISSSCSSRDFIASFTSVEYFSTMAASAFCNATSFKAAASITACSNIDDIVKTPKIFISHK